MIDPLTSVSSSLIGGFHANYPLASIASEWFVVGNFWLWQFFGRLHPMIVHFPIVLLVVVLFLELFTLSRKKEEFRAVINVLLLLGATSAVIAVAFGWFLKIQDDYSGELLDIHQWVGIATAVLALITTYLHGLIWHKKRLQLLNAYRSVLIFAVLGVSVAGHYGAELTHGEDFLTEVLPWNGDVIEGNPNFDINQLVSNDGQGLSPNQVADLNLEVRSIFAHNCYKCHSSAKVKGELRLDEKKYVMKGGESGDVISVGHPEKSEMIRRLLLPRDDDESMPPKGKTLTQDEIATLQLWIKVGAPWPDSLDQKSVFRVADVAPRNPPVPDHELDSQNEIDAFVNDYFEQNKIRWPEVVNDRIYIRRVYLDIIGLLPSPEEIDVFVKDQSPGKRAVLVKDLLNRNDDYALHWLTFWNDALRNDYSGTGYITGGRFAITDWLYASLRENKPYDQFVQQLISPDDEKSSGFIRGIRWRGTVNASQRVEMQAAQNVSQVFLGLNLKCASCHDSFVSDWTLKQAYEFANIFSDSALEINRCDVPTGEFAGTKILFTELGEIDSTATVEEKLAQLAEFLTAPKNGRLYRTIVNRMWSQLMGRGIVAPTDLMDNIPWSQDLLDWLAYDFVQNGNDLKKLIFKIATSKTYQLPSVELPSESALLAEDYVFAGMHRRRLSAEQFADAVSTIIFPIYADSVKFFDPHKDLDATQDYMSPATPFVRASLVKNDAFLTALGRPNRENVLTSRSTEANLLQALEVTNGERFNNTLQLGAQKWVDQYRDGEALIKNVYIKALGRPPLEDELEIAMQTVGKNPQAEQVEDFLWSIMLLPEFQLIY